MALAVALVACQGAAGTPGPAGPPGPPGEPAPTTPTTPTDPTTPTEPAGPTGAAPVVSTPFTPVYLALEGTGRALSKTITLDSHITDSDSHLKFTASSSDATIAKLGAMTVNSRSVAITAVRVGTVTITVEARDGDNPALMAQIPVTVVRNNAQPTTNDLSKADRDELEKRLYVADGPRTDTVTVVASAGGTSTEALEDSIADFKVVVGTDDKGVDDLVTVSVTKGTGTNKYDIKVTPKPKVLNVDVAKMQPVKIYPKDMFEAPSSEAWEFMAMFNTPPRVLDDSIDTIRLVRPFTAAPATDLVALDLNPAGVVSGTTIKISDYFDFASLQRMVMKSTPDEAIEAADLGTTADNVADLASKMDLVGDTVCDVTVSTDLAVVQKLNEAGEVLIANVDPAGTVPAVAAGHMVVRNQALAAILIDSRVSKLANGLAAFANKAEGEGAFDITIRCTDKDATAEVTGRVIVQQASS